MNYLIDTSVIINFLRNKPETVEYISRLDGELTSSFICLAELYEGVFRNKEKVKTEKAILDFFTGLSFIYGLDKDISKDFGQIRSHLKSKGNVIEDMDILIASTCIANNLTLITANPRHFSRIPSLQVLSIL